MSLHEVLTLAIQQGYYVYTKGSGPQQYIKFTSFGSQACNARIFDENGEFIKQKAIRTEERRKYELVPQNLLPEKLRALE